MKIVAGMSMSQLRSRVVSRQLELGGTTDLVGLWMEWFKCEPCDYNKINHERCHDCEDRGEGCEDGARV
ncbi:hypothetical protein ACV2F4_07900 [Salmonella enterica subsp. houtenae serovar 6,7:z4,z24:-]